MSAATNRLEGDTDPVGGADRVRLLSDVAAALGAAGSVGEVMRALARAFVPAVCDGFEVVLPSGSGRLERIVIGLGDAPALAAREQTPVPEVPGHPVRVAMATGSTLSFGDDDEHAYLFGSPDDPTSARALGIRAAIVAPIVGRSATVGALAAGLGPSGRRFAERDEELMTSVGRLAGLAIENIDALERQERTAALLERAAGVGVAIAAASSEREVAELAVSLAREELGAASGFVYLLAEDGELHLSAYSGYEEAMLENWQDIATDADVPVADAWREGATVALGTAREIAERYPGLGSGRLYTDEALVATPLLVRSSAVGAVYWGFDGARGLGTAECRFAEVVAEQCAAGLVRARAEHERAAASAQLLVQAEELRHIASTLQASMMPPRLPAIPGVELSGHHWPGGVGVAVSGDFYDVFPLGGGRWGILIGDVCGKGVEAAVVSSLARHTARAAALHVPDPRDVLRWVHEAVSSEREGRSCTVAYGVIEVAGDDEPTGAGGGARIALALGGHPQPLLVRSPGHRSGSGSRREAEGAERARGIVAIGRPGTLLGMVEPSFHLEEVELAPGDLLAFYTDGITDAPRGRGLDVEELGRLLVEHREQELDELGARVKAALDERRGPVAFDDTALLLLRIG